jgi:hypothetical protein
MNKNQVYAELLSAQHIFGVVFHDGRHRLANNALVQPSTSLWEDVNIIVWDLRRWNTIVKPSKQYQNVKAN